MHLPIKRVLAPGLLSIFFVILLFYTGIFATPQARLQDRLYGHSALENIVILAIDDQSIQQLGRWPWNRTVYANVLDHLHFAKAVGIDVVFSEQSTNEADQAFADSINRSKNVVLAVEHTEFAQINGITPTQTLLPISELRQNALALGTINLITDPDGVVRSAHNNVNSQYPLFAESIAKSVTNVNAPRQNRLYINMAGPKQTYKTIPVIDVISGKVPDSAFENKIVLIGATAPDLHDDHFAPMSGGAKIPGVEIQANLVQTILSRQHITPQNNSTTLAAIIITGLIMMLALTRLNAWLAAFIGTLMILIHFVIAIKRFDAGIISDMVYTPLSIITTYSATLVTLYLHESKQKKYIHDAFSKYVAPEVVSQLMKNPEKLKLGGDRREITIFFSDIRGFTSFSEQLTPEKLVQLLNEYLTAMTDIIMDHGGVVDKYIGDAIMAFWGAPIEQPDHATRAAKATVAMQDKLKKLQKKWEKERYPVVEIGAGINTGPAVIGNMGSLNRFNYTCMGDTINLGSRLEGITKEYGVKTLIAESTRKQLDDSFVTRELDLVRVKGKKEPIRIFELVGMKDKLTDKQKHTLKHFEAGLVNYRAKEFKKAIADFAKAVHEGDKTSTIYIERCEHFIKEHPGKDWDCVWVMKTK